MLEINTFKSLIHKAVQFEYASWCKERDKKRAREISLDSGVIDKAVSELVQYDEYAFESYVISEVDQEFHFRNGSKPQNNPEIFLYGYDGPGNRGTDGT